MKKKIMVKKFNDYSKINESNDYSKDFIDSMGEDKFQSILKFEDAVFNLVKTANDMLMYKDYEFDIDELEEYMSNTLTEYFEGKAYTLSSSSPISPGNEMMNINTSMYEKMVKQYKLNKDLDKFNI